MNSLSRCVLVGAVMMGGAACDDEPTSKEVRVIVKLNPHPWFDRLDEGVRAAAIDYGVTATMVGAPTTDIQDQIDLIHQAIADGVRVIGVVPNGGDPTLEAALAATYTEAREAGITVLTHEQANVTTADWDIETIDNEVFAEQAMQTLGDLIGGSGDVGHFVGGGQSHRDWNATARTYAQNTWGNAVRFVSIETDGNSPTPCAEDAPTCKTAMAAVMAQYPNLKGMLTFGSQGAIGAGQHLMEVNNTTIAVVGVAVPSQAKALVEGGWIDRGYLWDPRDAGYALVAVGHQIANGNDPAPGLTVEGLGEATVVLSARDIYFNKVLEITQANVSTFTF